MGLQEDIKYAERKRDSCGQNIPLKLEKLEARIYHRLSKSKRSQLKKLDDLYKVMDKLSAYVLTYTPCKKHCSNCCYIRVDVSEIEIQYIEEKYNIKRNQNIQPNTDGAGSPCCFLKDGSCSIYEGRPLLCRTHFFFTPDNRWCAHDADIGANQEFPLLRFSEIDKSLFNVIMKDDSRVYDIREVFGNQIQNYIVNT